MIKKSAIIMLVGILLMQFVFATTTEIKIKTPSFFEVHLTVLDSSSEDFSAIASYKGGSDFYGDANFTHSSDDSVFDLNVVLKKLGERVYSERFSEKYVAGKPIYLEIIPEGYELIETPNVSNQVVIISSTNATTNVTGNETETTTNQTNLTNITLNTTATNATNLTSAENQTSNKKSGISGKSIFGKDGLFSFDTKILYYIGGAILLLIVIFFIFKFIRRPREIRVTKLSDLTDLKEEPPKENLEVNKLIKDAEDKIKKAQTELDGLKKENRIKEIKAKLAQDRKELRELSRR